MTKNSNMDKLEALLGPDYGDRVAFYSDEEIKKWLEDFKRTADSMFIPGCPFSYPEIRREYLRRDLIKED